MSNDNEKQTEEMVTIPAALFRNLQNTAQVGLDQLLEMVIRHSCYEKLQKYLDYIDVPNENIIRIIMGYEVLPEEPAGSEVYNDVDD